MLFEKIMEVSAINTGSLLQNAKPAGSNARKLYSQSTSDRTMK